MLYNLLYIFYDYVKLKRLNCINFNLNILFPSCTFIWFLYDTSCLKDRPGWRNMRSVRENLWRLLVLNMHHINAAVKGSPAASHESHWCKTFLKKIYPTQILWKQGQKKWLKSYEAHNIYKNGLQGLVHQAKI